jgi:hypothetical protein
MQLSGQILTGSTQTIATTAICEMQRQARDVQSTAACVPIRPT